MSAFTFTKAVKQQEKLRLALDGPAGSGKTWTALIIATDLAAREGGRVAVIDSERSSAKKYASDFDFDHLTLPDWSPHTYMGAVRSAVAAGYSVIIIDSFSHAWEGVLELKDNATARSRSKNSYTEGWREATPVHNELVDTVLRADAHIIATLRTKTEYVIEEGGGVKKIGTKPIQRDGVDFEFDVVGDMTAENSMVISKTRCSALAGQVIRKPDARIAEQLWNWLTDGTPPIPKADPAIVEQLRSRLNALTGKERADFKARFGLPADLRVDQLEDAMQVVAEMERDLAEAPDEEPATEPAGDERIDKLRGHFFALCAQANVDTKGDDGRKRYHALLKHSTGGEIESTTQLTRELMDTKVKPVLTDVMEGRLELHLRANGEYEVRPVRLRSVKEKAGA